MCGLQLNDPVTFTVEWQKWDKCSILDKTDSCRSKIALQLKEQRIL